MNITVNRWQNGRLRQVYLNPSDPEFGAAVIKNLVRKYQALTGRTLPEGSVHFEVLSEAKSRLVGLHIGTAEEMRVRGFHLDFALIAPPELHKIAWLAGLGEKNALGFGAIRQLPAEYELMRQTLKTLHQQALPAAPTAKQFSIVRELALAA
jgi:CRISPR-associated endoribonuclease Cas6